MKMKTAGQKDLLRQLQGLAAILLSILLAFCISGIFISLAGKSPIYAFSTMITGALGSASGLSQVLIKSTPILLIGLGVCIGLRGGLTNLGGDGQLIMGAMAAIMIGVALDGMLAAPLVRILAFIGGALAGGIWGGLVGLLKAKFHMNVIITTIMLNYITNYLLSYAVQGPLKAEGSYLPQTQTLPQELRLPGILPGIRAHMGVVYALILAVGVYLFLRHTDWGYQIRVLGQAPRAAEYAGVRPQRYTIFIMFLAGAFAGAAGMIEMYGVYYRGISGIRDGVGFTAVSAALLAGSHPLLLIPASLFFGMLSAGANVMQVNVGIPNSVVNITQGTIILFALISPVIGKGLSQLFHRVRDSAAAHGRRADDTV